MKTLGSLNKWMVAITMFLAQAVWADDWMTNYYERPSPERFVAEVQGFSKAGHLSSLKTGPMIAVFLGRVMAANPVAVESWLSQLSDLTGGDRETLLLAAGFSRTQEARSFLAKQPDGAKYLGSLMDIRAVEPEDPEVLDMLWADFFATGEVAPLRRLVHVLNYDQYAGAMERYAMSQKIEKDREDAMRDAAFQAARWSLQSNAQQHRRVGELLEQIYWKGDLTQPEQVWLSAVLAKAMPEKYEFVQIEPGRWSFKRK